MFIIVVWFNRAIVELLDINVNNECPDRAESCSPINVSFLSLCDPTLPYGRWIISTDFRGAKYFNSLIFDSKKKSIFYSDTDIQIELNNPILYIIYE